MNNRNVGLIIIATLFIGVIIYLQVKRPQPIKRNIQTLIVGTNSEYPPFSLIDNNELAGFEIDVAREIAKRMQKQIEFKDMSFDALIPEIQLGTIHMIAAGMTPTKERAQRVLFTKPHHTGDPLIIISSKDNPINSIDELKGKKVAVNEGYSAEMLLSDLPDIDLVRLSSSSVSDGILSLQSNRADAYVVAQSAIQPYFNQKDTKDLHTIPVPDNFESVALAISKKFEDLFSPVQKALDEMQADGTLDNLKKKWNLHA